MTYVLEPPVDSANRGALPGAVLGSSAQAVASRPQATARMSGERSRMNGSSEGGAEPGVETGCQLAARTDPRRVRMHTPGGGVVAVYRLTVNEEAFRRRARCSGRFAAGRIATMTETTLTISGMHCGHCVMRVQKALGALPGVKVKQVEIGKATLAYDPAQATTEVIRQAIEGVGYGVEA
jgi:copper chaperone CopZ